MVELEGQHFATIMVTNNYQWVLKLVSEHLMKNGMFTSH